MSNTVTVACKIPNGLYLKIYELVDATENSPMGPRTVKMAMQKGETIEIKGPATPFNYVRDDSLAHGYALTRGVSAEFWQIWLEQNKDSDLIKNKMVFASPNETAVMDRTLQQRKAKIRSGLEPIDPANPPQAGLSLRNMKIQTADEQVNKPRVIDEDRPVRRERV